MNPETDYNLQLLKAKMGMANDLKSLQSASSASSAKAGAQADREKKWKAALDFQSMFLGQMYKAMRKSTMGADLTEKSSGREIFTEMLDQEYARMDSKNPAVAGLTGLQKAGAGTSNSLAAQIYRSLLRQDGQTDGMEAAPAISFRAAFTAARNGLAGRRQAPGSDGAAGAAKAPTLSGAALDPIVEMASKTYGVAKNLIKSVIGQESGSRHLAVSPAGAKGLMQLMDTTAADLGVRNVFNPRENVMAGTLYLKRMLDRFGGDEKLALAAYNAGPGAVERFGGIPPYAETREYVEKVLAAKAAMDVKDGKDAADAGKGAAGAAR